MRHHAAINHQEMSGDEFGLVAGEEGDGMRDIIGLAGIR